jgi:hypothetical protein
MAASAWRGCRARARATSPKQSRTRCCTTSARPCCAVVVLRRARACARAGVSRHVLPLPGGCAPHTQLRCSPGLHLVVAWRLQLQAFSGASCARCAPLQSGCAMHR